MIAIFACSFFTTDDSEKQMTKYGSTFSLVPQDTATGNFTKIVQRVPVKIVLDNEAKASGLLRAGLQVTATVSTKPDCE